MAEIAVRKEKKRKAKAADNYVDAPTPAAHPLDSEDVRKRFSQVKEWRQQARLVQAEQRHEMAIDQNLFDGIQWTEEEKTILEGRGQAPLVFNLIAVTVRWITGTEKRTRVDYRVLPRKEDGLKDAESKTQLLKYVADVNKEGFHRSRAFADAAISGLGWLEDGIRNDTDDEPLYCRYESWRNIWYDPLFTETDLSDCRYLIRERWVDLDIAQLMFPDRKSELESACDNITSVAQTNLDRGYDNPFLYDSVDPTVYFGIVGDNASTGSRRRVKLIEAWYRTPEKTKVIRGDGTFNGAILNEQDPIHKWALDNQLATTYDAIKQVMRCMIFCGETVLQDAASPYWHNRFPFTPVWCYRRGSDNAPYGIVRGLRDPQQDLNKRRAKALQLLSTKQVIADKGAVDDVQDAMAEIARPDGWIEKNSGKELQIRDNGALAQEQVALMDHDARFIQEAGGVTDENLGRQTNAISGKAIEARQNQGYTATSDLFDNLRLAIQLTGERHLSLIEQFYDQEKVLRLTGERKDVSFVTINGEGMDPVTASQADFIVDEQDYRGTVRQAMFDTILEMSTKLPPEVGLKLLTLAFEMSDVPMRDDFVKVLRDITGMKGPNEEDDPEKAAAEQQAAAQDQAQQSQAMQLQQTNIAMQMKKLEEDIRLVSAKANEAEAKGDKAKMEAMITRLDALLKSMDIAGSVATVPQLATAADQILNDVNNNTPDSVPTAAQVAGSEQVNNIPPALPAGVQ